MEDPKLGKVTFISGEMEGELMWERDGNVIKERTLTRLS